MLQNLIPQQYLATKSNHNKTIVFQNREINSSFYDISW